MPTIIKCCEMCARSFGDVEGRRGAERLYCGERCKKVASEAGRLEASLDALLRELTADGAGPAQREAMARLRGKLFRIANLPNCLGKLARTNRPKGRKRRDGWRGLRGAEGDTDVDAARGA